jgi:hypothetical protein
VNRPRFINMKKHEEKRAAKRRAPPPAAVRPGWNEPSGKRGRRAKTTIFLRLNSRADRNPSRGLSGAEENVPANNWFF